MIRHADGQSVSSVSTVESDGYSSDASTSSSYSSASEENFSFGVASKQSCDAESNTKQITTLPHPLSCPDDVTPDAYIQMLLESFVGFKPKIRPTLELTSVTLQQQKNKSDGVINSDCSPFIPTPSEDDFADYSIEVVSATRDNDMSKLRELHTSGHSLYCCNRFGESLLHMACRRGFTSMVKFLIEDANVTIRRSDDCGRTPFHDALWNRECQYDIVEMLVFRDPSLLLTCDKNGHTPFAFARREHWHLWRQFLWDRRNHIREAVDKDVMTLFR